MNRLREYRRRRGLTQARLARKCGVSQSNISILEHYGDTPLSKTARRLAAFFDVKPSALFPDGIREPNYWWHADRLGKQRADGRLMCSWCGFPAGPKAEHVEIRGHAITLGHEKCRQEHLDTQAYA